MQPDSSATETSEREQTYSPLVRRLAEEFEVDLSTVVGTGPGGRVTRADVQQIAFGESPEAETPRAPAPTPTPFDGASSGTPMTTAQPTDAGTIELGAGPARRAGGAADTVGTGVGTGAGSGYTVFIDVDAAQLLRAHRRLSEDRDEELPLIALIARLVVSAFDLSPELRPEQEPVSLQLNRAGAEPLLVPGAERLSLIELSGRIASGGAEPGSGPGEPPPAPDLVIEDLLATGVRAATPLVPASAVAAVAVGTPQGVARIVDGQLREVPVLTVTAGFNAARSGTSVGARFLAAVASNLEDPILAFAD